MNDFRIKVAKFKAVLAGNKYFSSTVSSSLILVEKFFKYRYQKKKYKESFLFETDFVDKQLYSVPEIIYIFWTGTNEMSEQRRHGVNLLRQNSGVEVSLIDAENYMDFVLSEYPLHCAYEYLSLVHKSDYLRCYFMYHYGGGYSDIKPCQNSWKAAFAKLNSSDKYALGYREILGGVASLQYGDKRLSRHAKRYYFKTIGVCAFIFKPNSPIAKEWIDELHKRLDILYPQLKKNPGNIWGDNKGYPVPWSYILGQILNPLFLKYNDKLVISNDIQPVFKNYR